MLDKLPQIAEERLSKFTPGVFKSDDENFHTIEESHPSPSGKYTLLVSPRIGSGWAIRRGVVIDEQDKVIIDIIRTYGTFPFAWFQPFKNSPECILLSEQYYGTWVYCPKLGPRPLVSGSAYIEAFCPGQFMLSPDNRYMVVCGCNWAAPWEYKVFNLESVFNGYLSCISVGDYMICGDEKPPEGIEWLSDKVVINSHIDMSETDVPDIKKYRYTVSLLTEVKVEKLRKIE